MASAAQTSTPPTKKGNTPKAMLLGALGLGLLVVVGLAGAWLYLPHWLLNTVETQAAEAGVELRSCAVDWSFSDRTLTLRKCQFRLIETPEFEGSLGVAVVRLEGTAPKSVTLTKTQARLVGIPELPPVEHLHELLNPSQEHRLPIEIAVVVEDGSFAWHADGNREAPPALSLRELSLKLPEPEMSAQLSIPNWFEGQIRKNGPQLSVTARRVDSPKEGIALSLDASAKSHTELRVRLMDMNLTTLATQVATAAPMVLPGGLVADGDLFARVPLVLDKQGIRGDVRLEVQGVVLPVPKEISPLVSRRSIQLSTDFQVPPSNRAVSLKRLSVSSGVLRLSGSGSLEEKEGALLLEVGLSGALSCGSIVESAAKVHSDSPIAHTAARIVRQALRGAVQISVAAKGDLLQPASLKLTRSSSVGCGLKAETEDVLQAMADELKEAVQKQLPQLGDLLDGGLLPQGLPKLPKLPQLQWGKSKLAPEAPASPATQQL